MVDDRLSINFRKDHESKEERDNEGHESPFFTFYKCYTRYNNDSDDRNHRACEKCRSLHDFSRDSREPQTRRIINALLQFHRCGKVEIFHATLFDGAAHYGERKEKENANQCQVTSFHLSGYSRPFEVHVDKIKIEGKDRRRN